MEQNREPINKPMHLLSRFSHVWFFATLWTVAQAGSSVHGILQARTLELVAMPSTRWSSWPKDGTCVSYVASLSSPELVVRVFSTSATWEAQINYVTIVS